MSKLVGSFAAVASVLLLLVAAAAAEEGEMAKHDEMAAPAAASIKGEIVDLSCYLDHGAKGASHKKCATDCALKGLPVGLLAEDGKLYLLVEDHKMADAYKDAVKMVAEVVTVKGPVREAAGVRALSVQAVAK
ncbi:MAG: hypothetical protein HYV63_07730 [Candidatus Schekmanbacteria bacterium]|nr:hypothetical protein [Candidatus Schekmanbacteria bacterium]